MKNLTLFSGLKDDNFFDLINETALETALAPARFAPCKPHDEKTMGFSSPLPVRKGESDRLVFNAGDGILYFAVTLENKIMPAGAINEIIKEKVDEIEAREDRRLSKKERLSIKEEVIFELLPNALSTKNQVIGYFDLTNKRVIIEASSQSKAEDVLSLLRKAIGSLPVAPMADSTPSKLESVFTRWVSEKGQTEGFSDLFVLGEKASFVSSESGKISYKDESLLGEDVELILADGKEVGEVQLISLEHKDVTFMLTHQFQIKAIKAQIEVEEDDFIAFRASELTLEALLGRAIINDLIQALSQVDK